MIFVVWEGMREVTSSADSSLVLELPMWCYCFWYFEMLWVYRRWWRGAAGRYYFWKARFAARGRIMCSLVSLGYMGWVRSGWC